MDSSTIIYRVWSFHPKAHKPVVPTFLQSEELVASVAQTQPEVIYFFGER